MPDPITVLRSPTLVLPTRDIDTDQVIPARFLTTTQRKGLGEHLFADARHPGGCAVPLTDPRAAGCQILVAGENFGCGSSREHAAWALHDFGIRAVVSTRIADIFTANATRNGIVPVVVDESTHRQLLQSPWCEVSIDLAAQRLRGPGVETDFPMDGFAKECLLRGMDALDWLIAQEAAISTWEERT